MTQSGHSGSAVKAEDAFPVVLYADHGPPILLGLIEQLLGERAYLGVGKALGWPIGIFARRIIVEDEHFEPRTVTGPGIPASADRRESCQTRQQDDARSSSECPAAYRRHCR